MGAAPAKGSSRLTRRLATRQRILDAAIAEFTRYGMSGTDIAAIVRSAGVAHGTFYVHFPSKEHILLELEGREEARVAAELARFLAAPRGLSDTLTEVVRLVAELEQRVGRILFNELLAFHFSPTRPHPDEWSDHPVIVLLVENIEQARGCGTVHREVDAFYSAVFFLLGIYGVLSATDDFEERGAMTTRLVASAARGLEVW